MATTPEQTRHLVDRAVRIAKAERDVTCIIFPNDVQEHRPPRSPPRAHGTVHSGVGYTAAARGPARRATCERAADVLNEGERVAMLVGPGRARRHARR